MMPICSPLAVRRGTPDNNDAHEVTAIAAVERRCLPAARHADDARLRHRTATADVGHHAN